MASLDPSTVVVKDGLSQMSFALMTSDPTPSAHILRPLEHLTGWREGVMVEPLKNHSTSCARDRAWTARAGNHARKR